MGLRVLFTRPNQEVKVRRLVSVGSTVVGLVCYSYSTYFTHLFGEWSWWKIFLYLLFSCLVCLAVLFHKAWNIIPHQHEGLPKFLVVTSTTVFLFFSDRASKGESDAYGAISCAAFAVMSLSCRFNELLTVFTGALIVQLMGIKLLLGAVGVVLCFIFIVPAPYLERYLVEIQGQSQPYNQFQSSSQDEHQVIVDIDSLLLPSSVDHHQQPEEVVSYLVVPSSIIEIASHSLQSNNENDEIQEVVEVVASLESSEDQLLDELLQVIANIATDTRQYVSLMELFGIHCFWARRLSMYKYNYYFSVTSDIKSTSAKEILVLCIIIIKVLTQDNLADDNIKAEKVKTSIAGGGDWIRKRRHARWPVIDVDHRLRLREDDLTTSLGNILLLSVPAYANFINTCSTHVLTTMERLTSKAQNALKLLFFGSGSRTIFSFIDQWPTMNIKVLKLD